MKEERQNVAGKSVHKTDPVVYGLVRSPAPPRRTDIGR
jgi:hypothetical protein